MNINPQQLYHAFANIVPQCLELKPMNPVCIQIDDDKLLATELFKDAKNEITGESFDQNIFTVNTFDYLDERRNYRSKLDFFMDAVGYEILRPVMRLAGYTKRGDINTFFTDMQNDTCYNFVLNNKRKSITSVKEVEFLYEYNTLTSSEIKIIPSFEFMKYIQSLY